MEIYCRRVNISSVCGRAVIATGFLEEARLKENQKDVSMDEAVRSGRTSQAKATPCEKAKEGQS